MTLYYKSMMPTAAMKMLTTLFLHEIALNVSLKKKVFIFSAFCNLPLLSLLYHHQFN